MATWADLKSYVRSNYKISDDQQGLIKLLFETGNLRSQVVLLWHVTLEEGSEDWVQIESPFGELNSVNVVQALREIGNTVCGGMSVVGDMVTFRHAVPLLNLNLNEFERPLALVTSTADRLEHLLTGTDRY